ncbi:MAG: cupredoxin domain-containing protein [Nitrospirota bacterium]|nr:cupredoxin domain-containing protein [Nitrospirota bacterium]
MRIAKCLIQKGMFVLLVFFSAFSGCGTARADSAPSASPMIIPVVIQNNRFETTVLKVPRGIPLLFRVTNRDNSMEEFESYDMAFEVIVHPHQTIEVPVSGLGMGTYEYFGDFHPRTAHGKIIVQ